MVSSSFNKRVRYAETDKMGYLFYAHYANYYEIGRTELIRELGFTYRDLEDKHGIIMPVLRLESKYHYPAYYDDLLHIHTSIPEMPTKMITFETKIYNSDGRHLNTGIVKLFFIDVRTGKRVSCPNIIKEKLQTHFEKTDSTSQG